MTAQVLDGKPIAAAVRKATEARAGRVAEALGRPPSLAVVMVGRDAANVSYVGMQEKAAGRLGFWFRIVEMAEEAGSDALLATVRALNADPSVDAILVAAPLPRGYDTFAIQAAIAPDKDVEGVTPASIGNLMAGRPGPRPATAVAIMAVVETVGVQLAGARATVIGRSMVVGKPTAMLLLAEHATVTIAHSRTADLAAVTRTADVLVCAAGVAGLVRAEHVQPGALVIDAGTNPVGEADDFRLVGDAAYDEVAEVAGMITPVPGGVGPVTTAMLMRTVVDLAEARAAPAN